MSIEIKDFTDKVIKEMESATKIALKVGASYVQAEASKNAPVDTGRLRASIDYEVYTNHALIGTNVQYAPFVEYGTSKQSAQPYLEPALNNNKKKIQSIMADVFRKALK